MFKMSAYLGKHAIRSKPLAFCVFRKDQIMFPLITTVDVDTAAM